LSKLAKNWTAIHQFVQLRPGTVSFILIETERQSGPSLVCAQHEHHSNF
jgi:hypothetical protein